MLKAGIINVTGYAGIEIARILKLHPEVEITCITGRSSVGKNITEIFPHLAPIDMTISEDITESVDVVFSALPHAASAERRGPLVSSGIKAIDISADFRRAFLTWLSGLFYFFIYSTTPASPTVIN